MANEFRIKHGLIVTGSSYFSESMSAPNLPDETSPNYFMTWRQSDGRFEVTPSTSVISKTLAQACWEYGGYAVTAASGKFSLRGNGASRLDSNVHTLFFHKDDINSTDRSSLLSTMGNGSVITLYINNQTIKYTVTGNSISGNVYSITVSHLSGDSGVFSVGEELCLDLTVSSSGGSSSSSNCVTFNMTDAVSNTTSIQGDAVFYRVVGTNKWAKPFGTVDNNIASIQTNLEDINGTDVASYLQGFNGDISIAYSDPTTGNNYSTTFSYQGFSATTSNNTVTLYAYYAKGDSGYTIPNNESFTLCKV